MKERWRRGVAGENYARRRRPGSKQSRGIGVYLKMIDENKTKEELIGELTGLRDRLAALEAARDGRRARAAISGGSDEKFRSFVENAHDIVYALTSEGIFTYVSPVWREVLGHDVDEVWGRSFVDFMHPEDVPAFRVVLERVVTTGEKRGGVEYRIRQKNGAWRWLAASAAVIRDTGGGGVSCLGIARDITENKRLQDALQESEERFARAFNASPIPMIISTVEEGRYLAVNDQWCQMMGYRRDELLGSTAGELSVWAEPAERELLLSRYLAKGSFRDELIHLRTKAGDIRDVRCSTEILSHNDDMVVFSMFYDLTDRQRTEDALRESEKKFRTIFETFEDIYYQTDMNGLITLVSPSVERIAGWKPEELVGRPATLVYALPENRASLLNLVFEQGYVRDYELILTMRDGTTAMASLRKRSEAALRQREATLRSVFAATPVGLCIMKDRVYQSANKAWYDGFGYTEAEIIGHTTRMLYENDAEYERIGRELYANLPAAGLVSVQTRLRRKDGVFRDVILIAAPLNPEEPSLGTVVTIQDLTDYRLATEALSAHRRQLIDIIEFLPDATLVVDKTGKVMAWNRAIEIMTGIKKEEMLGKGDYEYALPFYGERRPIIIDFALHPDREIEKQYTAVQRVGDILFGESYTPNLPPGDIHLSATASVLRDAKGEIIAAIECIRDNTERKRLEERLNRAEKMESLGTLAGGVAHDLNNVLGVLVGYSELLLEKLPDHSPLKRYAENILQSGLRGAAIIQDLLTLARRGVTVSKVVDLNRVVFDCFRTPEFDKMKSYCPQVKIWTELATGLLRIKGSPVHLGKALMNLVANATESISAQGEVTIKTENRYLDCPLRGYDEMREGDYVVLTVADTGSGIAAHDLGKIFEPFYTKKVMGKSGTGLGLAVVWGTVKDHHGYIDVQSEEGKGSAFTLYFPATREELAELRQAVSAATYMGRGETILIVDDVESQREVAMSMLGNLGYRVEAVASGEEAVAYLKSSAADLVLLDMIMAPGIDGLETYCRIVARNPRQKAVIVSGFSETDRVKQAMEIGAGSFVRKPYILEKIGIAVRKELDRQQE